MTKLLAAATAAAACTILTAVPAQAQEAGDGDSTTHSRETAVALAEARAGTARYHDVAAAEADGFAPVSSCVSIPGLGGMGIHYANGDRLRDGLVPGEPEALLYVPQKNGRLRLVAVEYMTTAPATFPGGIDTAEPGPAPAHTLHAWIWKHNPAGTFAPFNPTVTCPAV